MSTPLKPIMYIPLHISWHLCGASVGILLGVSILPFLHFETFISSQWVIVAMILAVIVTIRPRLIALPLSCIAGFFVGAQGGATLLRGLDTYSPFYDENVEIQGRVSEDVILTDREEQRLRLSEVQISGRSMPGEVWLSTHAQQEILRGDIIQVEGRLSEGFGNIAASMHRAQVVAIKRPEPGDVGRRARDYFGKQVGKSIDAPASTLGMSFLSGHRRALPDELSQQLRILGLTHLVVASGFHLTLVVRFMRKSLAAASKFLATAGSMALTLCFLLITGFSTSMTRAALVTTLSLLAWHYGRKIHPVVLLLFVAACTVVVKPSFLWGDIGWYLSFAAFGGVIILTPLINRYFWPADKEPGYIRHLLIATLAAQLATFPIIASTFGHYSPLALFSNLFMMPLVPIAMLLTFLTGLLSTLSVALATPVALATESLLNGMMQLSSYLATLPAAKGDIHMDGKAVALSYGLLLIFTLYLRISTGHKLREVNALT